MIGTLYFHFTALTDGYFSDFPGRMMHGVFFDLMNQVDRELAGQIHDEEGEKPFSISLPSDEKGIPLRGNIKAGDSFRWTVSSWDDRILHALLSVPGGIHLTMGRMEVLLQQSPADEEKSFLLDANDFMEQCVSVESVKTITMKLKTPASFRVNGRDYPLPDPKHVFGSLAHKWVSAGLPPIFDVDPVLDQSEDILLSCWKGGTESLYLSKDRGVLAFTGTFTYDLSELTENWQHLFLLLSLFAYFAGMGRLTAQGMGQVEVSYR